jgi:hypothetical protein
MGSIEIYGCTVYPDGRRSLPRLIRRVEPDDQAALNLNPLEWGMAHPACFDTPKRESWWSRVLGWWAW